MLVILKKSVMLVILKKSVMLIILIIMLIMLKKFHAGCKTGQAGCI